MTQQFHFWVFLQRDENANLNPHVHFSIIYSSQIWKQPKCPLMDEWIKMLWYISKMEYCVLAFTEWIKIYLKWNMVPMCRVAQACLSLCDPHGL